MHDKHEQLGEFGAIPGAPNGPPTDGLTQSLQDAKNSKSSENGQECSLSNPEIPASEKATPVPAVLCASAPLCEAEKSEQKCAFSYTCTLQLHELAQLFPPMSDAEFADFKADIARKGVTDPIWIFEGKVIDGRNRLRACQELGIVPPTREWNGEGSPLEFVVSRNLHRRHLNETQRAMVAARLKTRFEQLSKERSLAGKELDPCENFHTGRKSEKAGALLNVSWRSVDFATKVISKGCPELIALVDRSELPVSKAAMLAALHHANQRMIIERGLPIVLQTIRELEAEIRDERRRKKSGSELPPEPPKTLGFGSVEARRVRNYYRLEVGDDWPEILKRAVSDWTNFEHAIDHGGVLIVKKKAG